MSGAPRVVAGGVLAALLAAGAARAEDVPPAPPPSSPTEPATPPSTGPATPPSTTVDPGLVPSGATARPTDAAMPPRAPAPPPGNVVVAEPPSERVLPRLPRLRHANTWDVNLEAGIGSVFRDADRLALLGRGRFGALFVRDTHFLQVGATVEYLTKVERPAFGLQGEYLNLEKGLWLQLGANLDTKARPGGVAAAGFSIFGVEVQVREYEGDRVAHAALLGKLRLPLGILAYALGERAHR